jgi:hypothetical protein
MNRVSEKLDATSTNMYAALKFTLRTLTRSTAHLEALPADLSESAPVGSLLLLFFSCLNPTAQGVEQIIGKTFNDRCPPRWASAWPHGLEVQLHCR